MRVLFLDFDGVLNSVQSTMYWDRRGVDEGKLIHKLCPIATANLAWLLSECPDLDIVISSTWRKHHSLEWLQEHLSGYGIPDHRIRGTTPQHLRGPHLGTYVDRGAEIDWFIKDWHSKGFDRIEDFIILDDNSDMEPHMDKLIQTDSRIGFSWLDIQKIAERWKIEKLPVVLF